ncbi:MAG: DUF927 domain-containing protein [Pseudomonadota bacterium]|nr:DUF927 domain-containing protein [Pseudomonadota bacterium]
MHSVCGVRATAPADPAPGLALLAKMAEAAAADPGTLLEGIACALDDPALLRSLGAAFRAERGRVEASLLRLAGAKGQRDRLRRLEKAIRDEAERQEREDSTGRFQAALERTTSAPLKDALQRVLGTHELPAGLQCPQGWEVTPSGIDRLRVDAESGDVRAVNVAHRPLIIEGRYRDIHDNTVTYAMAWPSSGSGWSVHQVPRAKAADSRGLVAFAGQDAPVTSNNASDLVAFLSDFEAANAEFIPEARVTSTMGWHGRESDRCFVWGRSVLRSDGVETSGAVEDVPPARWKSGQLHLLVADPGIRALADGFRAGGSWEGWLEMLSAALTFPSVMLGVYASLVPPLMAYLPTLPNFIVDFCGETSRGKTTLLRLAVSVWGCADERSGGLLTSWDNTRVYVERAAALTDYLPTFLDDTKRARKPEDVAKVLYDYASGIGRGRGSVQGIQRTSRAHGVLLSTGEAAATSFTNDGGVRARTLTCWGPPFGGSDLYTLAAVQKITRGALQHFGHAGPRLVRWLLADPQNVERVRADYDRALDGWLARCNDNPVAARAAQYLSALSVVHDLLHGPLGVPAPTGDPLAVAWNAVVRASVEADRAADALRDLVSWATSQQHRFHGRLEMDPGSEDTPNAGWLGAWTRREDWKYLALLPTELRGFLERQKFDADAIIRTWDERAWLLRDDRHMTRKVTVGDRKERCYAITRAACDLVGGGGE